MSQPLILVTNDDGVHAPGIKALADALAEVGDVQVVAPDREVSACSQSLTLSRRPPERVGARVHAVDGTPADCVNIAMERLLSRPPDLVFSGINRGANLGDDIYYSGTVGGAREGTFYGVHSVAISLATRDEFEYSHAAFFARRLARLVLDRGLPERTFLNVNVPGGRPEGVEVTVLGQRLHEATLLEPLDPDRQAYYWAEEDRDKWVSDGASDLSAVQRGLISVTPLQTDSTNHRVVAALQDWTADLDDGGREELETTASADER